MLSLCASVLAVVLTGEFLALGSSHIDDDSCDIFQEFRDLLHLRVKDDCTGEKEVWTILDRMFRHGAYGRHCMLQAIQELGNTFKNHSRTPPYCNCSGNYELSTYSLTSDLGNNKQMCLADVPYKQLFEIYFYSQHDMERILGCKSHHNVWHLLATIGRDLCQTDIVLHVAETFSRHLDACICRYNNLDAHICSKVITINDVAHGTIVTHPNASDCSPGDHSAAEAFVFHSCNINSTTHWTKGESIMDMCERIPLYSPIANFDHDGVYSFNRGKAGIFLGCLTGGFKIALQECHGGVQIKHIMQAEKFAENSSNFFLIRW